MGPMSQQPFSRPGAVDLSALKRPAAGGGAPAARWGGGGPGAQAAAGAYALEVAEENFQTVLEASMNALVLLVFYSPTQMPASAQLADDLTTLADEFEGKYLLGRVDIDTFRRSPRPCRSRRCRSWSPSCRAGRCRSSRTSPRSTTCAPPSPR